MSMFDRLITPHCYFAEIRAHGNVICFGAGAKARQSLPLLRAHGVEPVAFCDNNPELWGQDFEAGLPILSLDEVRKRYPAYCFVLTSAPGNVTAIQNDLLAKGETCAMYHAANPFKVDDGFLPWQTFVEHGEEFESIGAMLADVDSVALYTAFLQYKMTGNILPILGRFADAEQNSFFDFSLLPALADHTYVDVGAYTGDTIMQFLLFSGGRYNQVYGFEPDSGNYAAAQDFVCYSRMPNIEIRNCGLWSSPGTRFFYTVANANKHHYDSPNFYRGISHAVDSRTRELIGVDGEKREQKTVSTLDQELVDVRPTILKINALAADLEILKGGAKTIRRSRPAIILEYGCKAEYILETPRLLRSLSPDYRLFLRQKNIFGESKTILYAIPS